MDQLLTQNTSRNNLNNCWKRRTNHAYNQCIFNMTPNCPCMLIWWLSVHLQKSNLLICHVWYSHYIIYKCTYLFREDAQSSSLNMMLSVWPSLTWLTVNVSLIWRRIVRACRCMLIWWLIVHLQKSNLLICHVRYSHYIIHSCTYLFREDPQSSSLNMMLSIWQ